KSAQIREILISESAWEEMTCLFAPSLGMGILSLSRYYQSDVSRQGILIGFANHPVEAIVDGIRRLAQVI
ncbi:hypothetical protein OGV86_20085, partial [Citrobacter sp. Cf099]|nr:hypothetical protein [Citrobacter sp. Cf099]